MVRQSSISKCLIMLDSPTFHLSARIPLLRSYRIFILSLDVVDVAVVYSINSDGIKFSVRSERADVDAGN